MCDSHQSSSTMRSRWMPQASRCAPTPSEVTNGTVAFARRADRRVVKMIVVIVRHEDEIDRRHLAKRNGHGLEAFRPSQLRR